MQCSLQNEDSGFSSDTELWRRIPPDKYTFDDNLGRLRPKSYAFTDSDDSPMSVTVAEFYLNSGLTLEDYFDRFKEDRYGLASITVGLIKELNLELELDRHDDDPGHAVVIGKKSRGIRRRMAEESVWVVKPDST